MGYTTFHFNISVGLLLFCYFRQHLCGSLCAIEKNFGLSTSIPDGNYLSRNFFLCLFALVEGIKLVRIVRYLYAIFCLSMNLEVVRLFYGLFLVFMVYGSLILPQLFLLTESKIFYSVHLVLSRLTNFCSTLFINFNYLTDLHFLHISYQILKIKVLLI